MSIKRGRDALKQQIFDYLKARPNEWVNGGEFERMALDAGFKPSHADRRLRELREEYDGRIVSENRMGEWAVSTWWCYKASPYEAFHASMQSEMRLPALTNSDV